jgi:hypothetical protein
MPKHFDVVMETVGTSEFPMYEMVTGEVCVVTQAPPHLSVGIVGTFVVRANQEFSFPAAGEWTGRNGSEGFRVRRLRPGEQISIKGK